MTTIFGTMEDVGQAFTPPVGRRTFVRQSVNAMAGVALVGHTVPQARIVEALRRGEAAEGLFPRAMTPPDLHQLAQAAIDAAKSAGADFADVRVAQVYSIAELSDSGFPRLTADFSYGIRTIVDGGETFIHGCLADIDEITAAAKRAVATARGFANAKVSSMTLAETPTVQGDWATPIKNDPFTVPLSDQTDLIRSYYNVAERVAPREWLEGGISFTFNWLKEHRVFASTAGSLTSQVLYRSQPTSGFFSDAASASGMRTFFRPSQRYLARYLKPCSGGYETALMPDLSDVLQAASESALEASRIPVRTFELGRFPVVLDGFTLARLLGQALGPALEADRVLGYTGATVGSSYLAPPEKVLGQMMINPHLNVTASRAMPSYQAVKWDDEGVTPEDYTLIKDGIVMDYHTSRHTVVALADIYKKRGQPVQSHGTVVAVKAGDRPLLRMPHLTVQAAPGSQDIAALCSGIKRGVYCAQGAWVYVDQQLSSGVIYPNEVFEIVNGKLKTRLKGVGFQFGSRRLWQNLKALGDANTVSESSLDNLNKGLPLQSSIQTATAPAALFGEMDVLDFNRIIR